MDILPERDGMFYPIEVKLTSRLTRKDTRGIEAFRATYPRIKIAPGLVIAPTESPERLSENVYSMPWDAQ